MSAPQPQPTIAPDATFETRQERFESLWRGRQDGATPPRWQDFLPPAGRSCTPEFVLLLLKTDIEFRVSAGLPALLAEPYFQHDRLQAADARLNDAQQVELIRWEYQRRWNRGERAARRSFIERFPQHADTLQDLKPRWNCPRCQQKALPLDEDADSADCSRCGARVSVVELFPPRNSRPVETCVDVPPPPRPGATVPDTELFAPRCEADGLDLRDYQLLERLGGGGMGEVYLSRDPGLGRPLALKVLRGEWHSNHELGRRFEEEARITGSLQHPNIVPVYNLGRLPDGRLYFTMKVVRGQTLAELLAAWSGGEQQPAHLAVFEQVCQAVAYAHSKGVIHRDLKPENVMVGRFGEVQVVDWGLARVLTPGGQAPRETTAGASEVATLRAEGRGPQTHGALGTRAYMAPEQANAEWERADERLDVFGLGGILCAILTGAPPYRGSSDGEVFRKAQRGDVAEAFSRLDGCGADAELTVLARECLCPEMEGRPRDAGVVAARVTAYLAAVQQRLHAAEVERAAAQARAEEAVQKVAAERRARRLLLGLAAAILLLLLAGSGAVWMVQQQRARQGLADREVAAVLDRAGHLLEDGWCSHDLGKLKEARAEADRAAGMALAAGAETRERAQAFQQEATRRLERALRNESLLTALLDVSAPRETETYRSDDKGLAVALAQKSVDEQYADAFRRWGLGVDGMAEAEVVARLEQEPEVVRQQVVAALDAWMLVRRQEKKPEQRWRRLLRLAGQLDRSKTRGRLRALLAHQEELLAVNAAGLMATLGGAAPAWAALGELQRGKHRVVLEVTGKVDPATEPAASLVLLAQARSRFGDALGAEDLLRQAVAARPGQVVLRDALGKLLERRGNLAEAIECYQAVRAVRPRLGVALSMALVKAGRAMQGERVLCDLLRQQPNNPEMYFYLGYVQIEQKKMENGEAAYREAIRLQHDSPLAHSGLGHALLSQARYKEAEAACREAIRLKHDDPFAHNNLGNALNGQGRYKEAEAACREAIRLQHDLPEAHGNLGIALGSQGRHKEAEAAYREAIRLKHDYPVAHNNLGKTLNDQGRYKEAEGACREAIRLKPDLPDAHCGLGHALLNQGRYKEAEAACREAIRLKPDYPNAHLNLSTALNYQGRDKEAEAACREAIRLQHDFPMAHSNLGGVLNDQHRYKEAEAALREAIRLQPDLSMAHNNLGIALYGQGRSMEAEAAFRAAIHFKPDDPLAHCNLANALNGRGKWAEAEKLYRKALDLDPKHVNAHANLGAVLEQQGKWAEAEKLHRKAIELNPGNAKSHNALGWALYQQGKWREAATFLRGAIALDPKHANAHNNLGVVLERQDKLAEAEKLYRKAIELDPKHAWAHNNVAGILERQGKWVEAEKMYREAIRLYSKHANAHNGLGWVLQQQGKLNEAEKLYRKAIELDPNYNAAHNNLGVVLERQGKLAEAEKLYRKAIELDPKRAWAHNNLGWVLQQRGKLAEAEALYRKALLLDPKHASAQANLGVVLERQGKWAEAEKLHRKALALNPRNAQSHNNLGWALSEQGKTAEAEMLFRRVIELDPKHTNAHVNLGWVLVQRGRWAEAEKLYRKAIALDPRYAGAHNSLGWVLQRQGKLTEAMKHYRTAVALDPNHPNAPTNLRRAILQAKLPALLKGEFQPRNNVERLDLAELCSQQRLYRTSARLYAAAFAADVKLADDLKAGHRYDAACSAARAARGDGVDASADSSGRVALRGKALAWLRTDLALRKKQAASAATADRKTAAWALGYWLSDSDLSGVRDSKALEKLPAEEQKEWRHFWTDVNAARALAQKPPAPPERLSPPQEEPR